ncbi:MAG: hypothetical protein M3081_12625 [Gemmatimonadota bacterium]|nr:hypothetical protein [Gemmatimonadota bacterium]
MTDRFFSECPHGATGSKSWRSIRIAIIGTVSAGVFCHLAHAQVTARLGVAAGLASASAQTIAGTSRGYSGGAQLWFAVAGVPFGLRVDAGFYRAGERRFSARCPQIVSDVCGEEGFRDATDMGTVSMTYMPWRARLAPYLLAGIGGYRLASAESHYSPSCPAPHGAACLDATRVNIYRDVTTQVGTSAGVGLASRVGHVSVELEAQYHAYAQRYGRGHMLPLTLGLRF